MERLEDARVGSSGFIGDCRYVGVTLFFVDLSRTISFWAVVGCGFRDHGVSPQYRFSTEPVALVEGAAGVVRIMPMIKTDIQLSGR